MREDGPPRPALSFKGEGVEPKEGNMIRNPVARQGREFRMPGNVQATPARCRPLTCILLGSVQCLWGHFVHPHILGYGSR